MRERPQVKQYESTAETVKEVIHNIGTLMDYYAEDYHDLISRTNNVSENLKNFLGGGQRKNTEIHERFFREVEAETARAKQLLTQQADSAMANALVRALLLQDGKTFAYSDDTFKITLGAVEGFAIPLIEYMDAEDVQTCCEAYASKYPKNRMLPKQKELFKKMQSICGPVRTKKRSLFS